MDYKYNGANGHLIWSRQFKGTDTSGSTGYNFAGDLKIDKNQNILISGEIYDTLTKSDAFLAQLDTTGNILWTDTFDFGDSLNQTWRTILFTKDQQGFYVVGTSDSGQNSNHSLMVNAFVIGK